MEDNLNMEDVRIYKKRQRKKVGTQNEGVSAAYASKIRAKRTSVDRLKEDAPMHQNKKLVTLDEAAALYFERVKDKSDTINNMGRYNNHLKSIFGSLKLDEIT